MADDLKIGSTLQTLGSQTATDGQATAKSSKTVGKEEFLNLLVHQLKNQDPLDPMKSEEFSVQLAQFSSLEQLISINQKLGEDSAGAAGGGSSVGTMASFLGQEVTLKDAPISVKDGKSAPMSINLPRGTRSARIDLLNENGQVVGSQNVSAPTEGSQEVPMTALDVPDGSYETRIVAVNAQGKFEELNAGPSGIVEGFVLEPTPALLVNGQQVELSRVVKVTRPSSSSS